MPVRAVAGLVGQSGKRRIAPVTRVRGYTTPAPVGGWNARDSLASMAEEDAVTLENWFPEESWVSVRGGFDSHATGLTTAVESLMSWSGPDATQKLFAAANSAIYNATSAGAVGAADLSSLTNNRWQHTMFGTSAGNYLYIVNGADAPRHYDGTTWATPSLTVGTGADMIHINAFKRRLFFIEKNSLSFWYLAVVSISGALTEFDLGGLCSKGGYLMAMGTWTRDGGAGVDDFAVFVTSMGEVIIYQGSDPGTPADWELIGVFQIAPPIGRRCMMKLGSDLIIITEDGFSQLSRFLAGGRSSDKAALSDKISHAVNVAVADNKTRFGWQPIFYPSSTKSPMVIVNVPTATGADQYVSNATTGAWCKFTGQAANCWEMHGGALYFGGAAVVYKADSGLDDNGADIVTSAKPAFSYFGDSGRRKRFAMVHPNLTIDGAITVSMRVNVDFADDPPTGTASFTPGTGADWDTASWDTAEWAGSEIISHDWSVVDGIGYCAALRLKTVSQNGNLRWNSTAWLIEPTASAGYL